MHDDDKPVDRRPVLRQLRDLPTLDKLLGVSGLGAAALLLREVVYAVHELSMMIQGITGQVLAQVLGLIRTLWGLLP